MWVGTSVGAPVGAAVVVLNVSNARPLTLSKLQPLPLPSLTLPSITNRIGVLGSGMIGGSSVDTGVCV
jgi:hypothetical protein